MRYYLFYTATGFLENVYDFDKEPSAKDYMTHSNWQGAEYDYIVEQKVREFNPDDPLEAPYLAGLDFWDDFDEVPLECITKDHIQVMVEQGLQDDEALAPFEDTDIYRAVIDGLNQK